MQGGRPSTQRRESSTDRGWLPSNRQLRALPARALLEEPGCPACHAQRDATQAYFTWFRAESYAQAETIRHLRDAGGFCPRHTRKFLATASATFVPTIVYEDLVSTVFEPAPLILRPLSRPCLACRAEDNAQRAVAATVLDQLRERHFATSYQRHGGLCATHAAVATAQARHQETMIVLLSTLAERVASVAPPEQLRHVLGPTDEDAWYLHQLFSMTRGGDHRDDGASTERVLITSLRDGRCPVCAQMFTKDRSFVDRVAAELPQRPTELHLSCLAHHDAVALAWPALGAIQLRTMAKQLLITVSQVLSTTRRRAPRPWVRRALRTQTAHLFTTFTTRAACPGCAIAKREEERQLALIQRALRDPVFRELYLRSDGLCLHHVRGLDTPLPPVTLDVAANHLDDIHAQLRERLRKRNWNARHEPPGSEVGAALRAAIALDGRVFNGLTADVAVDRLHLEPA